MKEGDSLLKICNEVNVPADAIIKKIESFSFSVIHEKSTGDVFKISPKQNLEMISCIPHQERRLLEIRNQEKISFHCNLQYDENALKRRDESEFISFFNWVIQNYDILI